MAGILKDYLKVAVSSPLTRYGYGALGGLAAEIALKDVLGIPREGVASSALIAGNGFLGLTSCISLVAARFGVPALRAYHYGQRTLQHLYEVDEEFWEAYARADSCRRRGLDLAIDERLLDFE